MIAALSVAALIAGVLAIRAEPRGDTRTFFVCKPLTTLLLVGIALAAEEPFSSAYQTLVVAGLLLSLAGDVFLMLPSDRFVAGLGSFLLAHLCYIAAFAGAAGFQTSPVAAAPFALVGVAVFAALYPHLGSMKLPVAVYAGAIALMGWQALGQWLALSGARAFLAFAGATLFTISDAALALDRFRRPLPRSTAIVLGTYYPAQWLIALSVGG